MAMEQRKEESRELSDYGIGRLFGLVHDGVVVANARTEHIVLWNDAAAEMFGYTVAEALELPLHHLVPRRLRDLHRTGLRRFQETGHGILLDGGKAVELPALKKDGSEIPIELTLTAVPKEDEGGDRYAMAIIRDMSDRKAAERARLETIDKERRQLHALEVNDLIVQGLVTAKMAFDQENEEIGRAAVEKTLERAKLLVSTLLEGTGIESSSLQRDSAATVLPEGGSEA